MTKNLKERIARAPVVLISNIKFFIKSRKTTAEQKRREIKDALMRFYIDCDLQYGSYNFLPYYSEKADFQIKKIEQTESKLDETYAKLLKHKSEVYQWN